MNLQEEVFLSCVKCNRRTQFGLRDEEKSLAHLLDKEIIQDIENDMGEEMFPGEDIEVSERDMAQVILTLALKHSDVTLLNDILVDL